MSEVFVTAAGGMKFHLIYDADADAAPDSFRKAIETAAMMLSTAIQNQQVTVNIKIDYSGTGGVAEGEPDNSKTVNSDDVRTDLMKSSGSNLASIIPTGSSDDMLPICFKAGSLGEGLPRRDLWISPHHAMYLDRVLIEAKDLVNGVSIVQVEEVDRVDYFHIELDSHDVVLAEGAWSESFVDDDSRGMFHNVHEYAARYPDEVSRPAHYCAPRLEIGYRSRRCGSGCRNAQA